MIQELESWGVKFQKTATGDYDIKKVHHRGSYVLPMPEGYDIKKLLTRMIRRVGVKTENQVMATRVLTDEGRAVGVVGLNVRTGEFVIVRSKVVILCCGAAGRLGCRLRVISWEPMRTPPMQVTVTPWLTMPERS
jgi:succinate dehydrogenase/fumarate reductase flavoprotein subunit